MTRAHIPLGFAVEQLDHVAALALAAVARIADEADGSVDAAEVERAKRRILDAHSDVLARLLARAELQGNC